MKKIAVPYENGQIFQHFGKTAEFKVYEAEGNKLVSSKVIASNGTGHSALAEFLSNEGVNVVICGGIGDEAQSALAEAGIKVYYGAEGDVDEIIARFLEGEPSDCGCGDGCDCGGSCGDDCSCGGGCGGCGSSPAIEGKNVGKTCKTHYKGTFNDGTVFDSSYDRGTPLEFVCGAGSMIYGFDAAVANMEVGEIVNVHLMPEEAYGQRNLDAIFSVEIANLPGSEELNIGERIYLTNQMGQEFPAMVIAKTDKMISFDANHEMAGKELNFEIELVEVL